MILTSMFLSHKRFAAGVVALDGSTSSDPDEEVLSYASSAAVDNPASVVLTSTSIVRFTPRSLESIPSSSSSRRAPRRAYRTRCVSPCKVTTTDRHWRRPGPIMPPLSEATSSSTGPVVRTPTATRSRSYGRRWSIPTSSRSWTQSRCRPRSSPCCLGRTHSNSRSAMGP